MHKILITGGAGFIGSHLAKKFIEKGDEVHVIDNLSTGKMDNIKELSNNENFYFSIADLKDLNFKELDLWKYDEVYHLAAVVGVTRVLENPLDCIETNLEGTKKLLDAIRDIDVQAMRPKVFIASTSEVYGKNDAWSLDEDSDRIVGSTHRSRWIYADTKAMDEFIATIYSKKFNIKILVGRFFSIVGPGQSAEYGMVLPRFVKQSLKNENITVYGDGTQIRSFLHVDDCVNIVVDLMRNILLNNSIINIGNPEPVMIKDLAKWVKHYAKSNSSIEYVPYNRAFQTEDFEDMYRRVPNISKLEGVLGVDKKVFITKSLDEIILETIEYVKNENII